MGTTETRALRDARARWRKRDARAERALGRLLLWLALGLMAACATELTPGAYRCEPGLPGQCPAGWGCQVRAGTDEGRCYPDGATCGDGILGSGEECDGLAFSEEAACPAGGLPFCTSACRLACTTCGNGVLEATPVGPREECDDGNLLGGDGCSASCLLPRCGDGVLDLELFEECDDGAGNSNSRPGACRLSCRRARCGDGVVDAPRETCDDGNLLGGDGCNATCNSTERCGNGFIDTPFGETCDDANFLNHDGCSSSCKKEELGFYSASSSPRGPWQGTPGNQTGVYDPARHRMVIYGGVAHGYGGKEEYDETFESGVGLRHGGLTRSYCDHCEIPSHFMFYDSKKRAVLRSSPEGILEWTGSAWVRERTTAHAPVNRGTPPMGLGIVYDPRVGKTLRFWNKVSEWDPHTESWIDVADGPPHASLAAVYDVMRGYVVVPSFLQTYIWDHRLLRWTTYDNGSWRLNFFYDGVRKSVVGAPTPDGEYGYTEWNGTSWEPVPWPPYIGPPPSGSLIVLDHTRAGYWSLPLGVPAPVRFYGLQQSLLPAPTTVPPALPWSAVTDERRRQVVAWIGGDEEKETWEWNAQAWSRKAVAGATPKVPLGSLHYDPARQRVLLVARQSGEVWSWDGVVWSQLVAPGPNSLDYRAVYDRRRHRLLRIGSAASSIEVLELQDGRWIRQLSSANPGAMLQDPWYDIPRQRVLVATTSGTWEWTGESWYRVSDTAQAPPGVYAHATGLTERPGSEFGYRTSLATSEFCPSGLDADHDSLAGCEDPDCWPYCTPGCLPGESCAPGLPHCGDGVCDAFTETCRMCPGDCGACAAECGDLLCDPGETAATCPGDCP